VEKFEEHCAKYVNAHQLRVGDEFSANEKNVRYKNIPDEPGMYVIRDAKTRDTYYVGETGRSIRKRIANHKRSIRDPDWVTEASGKKFHAVGVHDRRYVVEYLLSSDVNTQTKQQRVLYEHMLIVTLNPLIYISD
jgi:hypothetical protein